MDLKQSEQQRTRDRNQAWGLEPEAQYSTMTPGKENHTGEHLGI